MFYNGNLYFNNPIEWINQAVEGNVGQGDLLEGAYSNVITKETVSLREDAEIFDIDNIKYLRSQSIVKKWLCLCFYSISEQTKGKIEEGAYVYNMAKGYIESFCHGETFELMLKKPLRERTSMVVIPQTGRFFKRLRSSFQEHGLVEEVDFYMHSVTYRKESECFVIERAPYELFSKNAVFEQQQEFRILLNPNSPKVQRILMDGHKICIGPMDYFAQLKTNFYHGATVKVKEHQLRIEDAITTNMAGPLNEWNLEPLLGFMQYAYHTTSCKLDGDIVDAYTFWVCLVNVFAGKYNIEIRHEEFVDGKDDHILLYFHGDDLKTILKNERKDSYYYIRFNNDYKAPTFDALYGGNPAGIVKITYMVKRNNNNLNK